MASKEPLPVHSVVERSILNGFFGGLCSGFPLFGKMKGGSPDSFMVTPVEKP